MSAQVAGVSPVARPVQRAGETGIARAVLGQAVRDLDDRPRRPLRQPAAPEKQRAVIRAKPKLAPRHGPPFFPAPMKTRSRGAIRSGAARTVKRSIPRAFCIAKLR